MHFEEFDISKLPSGEKATGWLEVASRADGGSWRLPLLYVKGTTAGPTLAVTAAVHGNEYEGPVALKHLMREIPLDDVRGRIILVPVLNPSAFHAGTRESADDRRRATAPSSSRAPWTSTPGLVGI